MATRPRCMDTYPGFFAPSGNFPASRSARYLPWSLREAPWASSAVVCIGYRSSHTQNIQTRRDYSVRAHSARRIYLFASSELYMYHKQIMNACLQSPRFNYAPTPQLASAPLCQIDTNGSWSASNVRTNLRGDLRTSRTTMHWKNFTRN
jgi:hypothetical protein